MSLPIRTRYVTTFLGLIWMLCCCYSIVPILLGDSVVYVSTPWLKCNFNITTIDRRKFITIPTSAVKILMMTVIVTSNLGMLLIAAKHFYAMTGRPIPGRTTFITISSVSWAYILSYTPSVIAVFYSTEWFVLLATYMLTINIIVNPIIYSFTNHDFKCFVSSIFGIKIHRLSSVRV